MKQLSKIGVISFAKFQATLMSLLGLVCGILYAFGGLIIDLLVTMGLLSPTDMSTPGLSSGTVLAFGALIGMPLIFGVAGFLVGLVEGPLYNLYAKIFGGIRVDLYQ